jgi:thiol-disulfide isomerase/thioredoxin
MRLARRELLILGAAGVTAAAAGALVGALALQSGSGAATLLAQTFLDTAGKPRRLQEWQGRVIACNFWATWCAPCREEIPLLNAAQHKYSAKNLRIVGIGIDPVAKIVEFSKTVRMDYPVLVAQAEAIDTMRELGNTVGGLPFTAILDRSGRLAATKLGAYKAGELDRVLEPLLG